MMPKFITARVRSGDCGVVTQHGRIGTTHLIGWLPESERREVALEYGPEVWSILAYRDRCQLFIRVALA